MGDSTTISWTDATWNVTRGCRRVSAGCENCYAERQANRFKGPGGAYEGLIKLVGGKPRWSGETRFATEHLADPLRWKSPRRIFVDSMSDLFYESFTNEQIAAVFGVMAAAPQHTFQVLTKRAKRMREWFEWMSLEENFSPNATMHVEAAGRDGIGDDDDDVLAERILDAEWPLPNVWLGVSVEDQAAADERIPELLATPAAVRFLSCEPLLGPVELPQHDQSMGPSSSPLDWVIAGCESGPGARPCNVEWLRSLRDQCAAAGVPYFLKQAVEDHRYGRFGSEGPVALGVGHTSKRKGGGVIELPYLDGVQHAAFPEIRHA
jgi:protein gp37